MRQTIPAALAAALLCLACASSGGSASSDFTPVSSTFDSDNEQWGIVGDAHGKGVAPAWKAAGGDPGGYIEASDDVTGGVWYWSAPAKFLQAGSLLNRTLGFDLRQNPITDPFDDSDIVLKGRNLQIVAKLPAPPKKNWTHYEVPFSLMTGWRVENLDGKLATWVQISLVFGDLQGLYIRGEYETGPDTGGLDNVIVQ